MNCENYSGLINALVEERLDEQTARKVILHLTHCRNCETRFENLFGEKELFADFIFEVRPLHDLSDQFRERLAAEKIEKTPLAATISFRRWRRLLFDSFYLKPVMAGAAVLLMIGLCYLGIRDSLYDKEQNTASQIPAHISIPIINDNINAVGKVNYEKSEIAESPKSLPTKNDFDLQHISVNRERRPVSQQKKSMADTKSTVRRASMRNAAERPKTGDDDRLKYEEMQAFKFDTRKQMEKIEMLLRSFRNAPLLEESDSFDIAYEKHQARNLLERNIKLRKTAQNYGGYDIQETLQTTEALLNDIADLDNNPSSEQVISIKKRINSQNIIAALQVF